MRFSKFSHDFPHSAVTGIISFTSFIVIPTIIATAAMMLVEFLSKHEVNWLSNIIFTIIFALVFGIVFYKYISEIANKIVMLFTSFFTNVPPPYTT